MIPRLLIKNAAVISLGAILTNQSVLCANGKIEKVLPSEKLRPESDMEIIDAAGKYLAPGFIDLHLHGLHHYLIDKGHNDLDDICLLLPKYGVIGFLAGVCPKPKGYDEVFVHSLAGIKSPGARPGAKILGFHFEGPFLAITGALTPEDLGKADRDRVTALIEAAKPYKAIFSISPELEGVLDLIPVMAQNSTPVFMTHTAANTQQTQAAIKAGVSHATHFYDDFPFPSQTDPIVRPCGAVEAILADPQVSVDFILDGVHVHPVAVKMAMTCKGPDRVCLITDASVGAGLAPGRYRFVRCGNDCEIEFNYPGAPARFTEKSSRPGTIYSGTLTLDLAVRNALKMLNVDLPQAVRMASANPAKVLGLDHIKGQIKEGYDADMVLLDKSLKVVQTWIGGKCHFSN